jgi:hypothetical protein
MRRTFFVILALALPGTTFAGAVLTLVPTRGVPLVVAPVIPLEVQYQARFSLATELAPTIAPAIAPAPILDAPVLTFENVPVTAQPISAAPGLIPASGAGSPAMTPSPENGSLTAVSRLTQDISRQQAAAGGNVLAAAPELGIYFDVSRRGIGIGGVVDAYTGLSPPQAAARPLRSLEAISELHFGTYNVENFFSGAASKFQTEKPKPQWQQRGVAKAILDSNLDIVSVEEMENVQVLEAFNEKYLDGQYRSLLIQGNDERGINIGFLVKNDIPFELELRTNKDELWTDPEGDGRPEKLFSRDLPTLIVRAPGRAQPLFVYLGTHYKSKRPRSSSDPESDKIRLAQVERTVEIIGRLRAEFGQDVPLMLGGDFNGEVNKESTFDALKQGGAGLTDALDLAQPPLSDKERVTHIFFPEGGSATKSQLDAIFLSKALRPLVAMAKVYRYKDASGKELPIPETWKQREQNPSDHFPLLLTIKFQPLLHP